MWCNRKNCNNLVEKREATRVDLPGMGKIIEEKELTQCIKENRQQLMK